MAGVIASLASLAVTSSASSGTTARGPWLLISLPEMGRISWSCDGRRLGYRRYALQLDAGSASATERVSLRVAGRTILSRTVTYGTVQLPHLDAPVQRIVVAQTTEPGTLRAVVTVDFRPGKISPSHCFPWLPPATTLRLIPR